MRNMPPHASYFFENEKDNAHQDRVSPSFYSESVILKPPPPFPATCLLCVRDFGNGTLGNPIMNPK
jgi:hypothetical protein